MDVKNFWESKTFWLNIITAIIMVLDLLVQQPFIPPNLLPFIAFAVGVLNIVLRIWFTDTGIASAKAKATRAAARK